MPPRPVRKTNSTVPWSVADAYVKTRDERWRDPKHVLFQNLKQFKVARVEIEKIASEKIKGTIQEIRSGATGDACQQRGLDGTPAASLDALYEIASLARAKSTSANDHICKGVPPLNLAPLKGRARAGEKARVRGQDGAVLLVALRHRALLRVLRPRGRPGRALEKIEADPRIEIVRTKNRFNPPEFNGYRDIMMNVAVDVDTPSGTVSHLCELQIHLSAIKKSEPMHKSHAVYEFFRSFFLGNAEAVEKRLDMFCALPVDDAKDADELVEVMLGSDADAKGNSTVSALLAQVDSGVRGRRQGPGSHLSGEGARVWCGEQGGGRGAVNLGNAY